MSTPVRNLLDEQAIELRSRLIATIQAQPHHDPAVVLDVVLNTYLNVAAWAGMLDQVPRALAILSTYATELMEHQAQVQVQVHPGSDSLH